MVRKLVALAIFVAGPLGWASHLLISYALVPASCTRGSAVMLNVATIVFAMLIAGAVIVGVSRMSDRNRGSTVRSIIAATEVEPATGGDGRALSYLGLLLAVYFTTLVLLIGLVAVIVDPCA